MIVVTGGQPRFGSKFRVNPNHLRIVSLLECSRQLTNVSGRVGRAHKFQKIQRPRFKVAPANLVSLCPWKYQIMRWREPPQIVVVHGVASERHDSVRLRLRRKGCKPVIADGVMLGKIIKDW